MAQNALNSYSGIIRVDVARDALRVALDALRMARKLFMALARFYLYQVGSLVTRWTSSIRSVSVFYKSDLEKLNYLILVEAIIFNLPRLPGVKKADLLKQKPHLTLSD